jgi:hypothetical protein
MRKITGDDGSAIVPNGPDGPDGRISGLGGGSNPKAMAAGAQARPARAS